MVGTRDRIIAATNELFRRTGYNATSLSQISKASGATIGSIYHFFPGGKDALTVEVIRSTGLAYRDLFTLMMDQAPDVPSGFAAFFDGAADVLVESDYLDPCPIGGPVEAEARGVQEGVHRLLPLEVELHVEVLRQARLAHQVVVGEVAAHPGAGHHQ